MTKGNFIGHLRLKGSKLPVVNFTQNTYDRILKTLDDNSIGLFMQYIYDYIYKGTDYNFKTKLYQNLWNDTLTQINKSAEWWFKKKEEEQQSEKLNISKNDIDSVFKTGNNYIGRIDNIQK